MANHLSAPNSNSATGWLRRMMASLAVLLWLTALAETRFMRPDLQNVPVDRLVANLQTQIEESPDDAALRLNLARVHAMAYTKKTDQLSVNARSPNEVWFNFIPPHVPFGEVIELDKAYQAEHQIDDEALEALATAAAAHLQQSIEHFRAAVELDPENLTSELGLAWVLDQAGDTEEAVERYRAILERGWEQEKDLKSAGLKFVSVVREAGEYLRQHLDPEADAEEIRQIDVRIAKVNKIIRPITPLAIPLGPDKRFQSVYDPRAAVVFDADGSGAQRPWTWTSTTAGWLVYDARQTGKITSALQMFGSVTFWCFWENGFAALETLDDNGDRVIAGGELSGVCIWHDVNQNGVSDLGEVRSVAWYGIRQIRCDYIVQSFEGMAIPTHPAGIQLANGNTLPVFDLTLRSVEPSRSD